MSVKTPAGLGSRGRRFWRGMTAEFDFGLHELAVLEQAARELDVIARLDEALDGAPLEIDTPAHGLVANRLLAEVRMHRGTFARIVAGLRLPEAPAGSGPVVAPAGDYLAAARRSRRGHRAA